MIKLAIVEGMITQFQMQEAADAIQRDIIFFGSNGPVHIEYNRPEDKSLYNKEKQDTVKQHTQDMQRAIEFTCGLSPKEEKPLHTYYCLFLPLGIYCGFGAENIHHAYNKAAKYWGAKNQIGRPYDDMPESKIQRDCRIYVFDDIKHVELTRKQVSHTLMTKLVKAWREENN